MLEQIKKDSEGLEVVTQDSAKLKEHMTAAAEGHEAAFGKASTYPEAENEYFLAKNGMVYRKYIYSDGYILNVDLDVFIAELQG